MSPVAPVAFITSAFLIACWVSDLRSRRIPNILSGTGILLGLVANGLLYGATGVATGLAGAVLCIGILLPAFNMGGIGGGDVKMMGAVGALLGPKMAIYGLCLGMMLGGMAMAVHLYRIGRLREKLERLSAMVRLGIALRAVDPLRVSDQDPSAISLPYSVPLGVGTFIVMGSSWSGFAF